jgi:DNA-directed RNA polymerase subunit M/transcription elongation factor TFIIS
MWRYKSCPRCHGDIFVDEDVDTTYVKCLQCGYEKELPRKFPAAKPKVLASAKGGSD